MKCIIFILLFIVLLCESTDNILCGLGTIDSLELYEKDFSGIVPSDCSIAFSNMDITIDPLINVHSITQIKLAGFSKIKVEEQIVHFENLLSLDISYSKYTNLNTFEHENLRKLNVSHNKLTRMSWYFFRGIPLLNEMDFSYNEINILETISFDNATRLMRMDLSFNNISFIEQGTFKTLKDLEYINLGGNIISIISMRFDNNLNLKTVRFEYNREIWDICYFASLANRGVSLYLTWERVAELRTWCMNKFHVVTTSQYEGLFPTTTKGSIELHCNEQSFGMLKRFRISTNQLENPRDILTCLSSSIRILNLGGNEIEKFERNSFKNLINLEFLSLKNTDLEEFDLGMLKSVTHLKRFSVSSNYLITMENTSVLKSLQHLENFDVGQNRLENTKKIIQELNPSVRTLDLNGNYVGIVNAHTFEHLINLNYLNLAQTQLLIIDQNPFEALDKLRTLDISCNNYNLESIDFTILSMTLYNLTTLRSIDCSRIGEHFRIKSQHTRFKRKFCRTFE